ncbi:MAG: FAD binding domain-containing protein [Spirochaetaceae bacterium]
MIEQFFKATTISEAVKLKDKFKDTALFFAGGTEINSTDHNIQKKQAISLELLGLNKIEMKQQELIIGSAVTLQQLIDSEIVPISVKTASKYMTNRNIRNMATIGGNIGVNRSCSNLIPILISLKAKLKVSLPNGEKLIDIIDFINSTEDELILFIVIPNQKQRLTALDHFTRTANDIAILNVAVSFTKKSEKLSGIIVAVGGVDKHVVRLRGLEDILNGDNLPSKEDLEALIQKQINPIDDIRGSAKFKTHLTGVMVCDCFYSAYNLEGK